MDELIEPICLVTFFSDEPNEAMTALGLRDNYWDGYFAGRAGPLGRTSADVVHAAFYNFGPGEVARHIPRVWELTTPEAAIRARAGGCAAALRRILGELASGPAIDRATELLLRAAGGAPTEGRVMFAALRGLAVPDDPIGRLWHAANMLREHRGDGHIAALLAHRIGGTEAHVLLAVDQGMAARTFGRLHHLPAEYLDGVLAGLHARGLLTEKGTFTPAGRAIKDSIESLTDELALAPYQVLTAAELTDLTDLLEPIAAALVATGSR